MSTSSAQPPSRILVVEDDVDVRRMIERFLVRSGFEVLGAVDGHDAIEKLSGFNAQLIITDLAMPRGDGRQVVEAGIARGIPVVVLTGQSTVSTAVELMRKGAANFLTKPFSPASLGAVLADVFGAPPAPTRPASPTGPHVIIGQDEPFRRVLDTIDAVATTDATVLISGETGTGKEVMARAIHHASRRARGPFVAVNCGAIPEPLLESELFGHAKGAFTGATHARAGRLQLAQHGTLFLDEIGDMPLPFQVKLLRVLQERQYEVLGEGTTRSADVRLIAATHRNLAEMVAEGTFREDLFYRLQVVELELPALRERPGDIALLASEFVSAANARHGTTVRNISPEVLALFASHRWPGNIRELANVVERMVIFRRTGDLTPGDLPPKFGAASAAQTGKMRALRDVELPAEGLDLRRTVAEFEGSLIDQALSRTGGNRNAAAQLLGLNRTTLVEKLRRK
jgi:two-component system, NtrC family, response regulator AtoC